MSFAQEWARDIEFSFRKQKQMIEQALTQLDDAAFFRSPAEGSNSVALIVKHLAGNLKSRWTDFRTTDGEKPWRDRDNEFVIGPADTRERLSDAWEEGWAALFQSLSTLAEADATATVTIRGEAHAVLQAVHRALTHAAYHTGQILYVARLVQPNGWRWITVPPGQSQEVRARGGNYLK